MRRIVALVFVAATLGPATQSARADGAVTFVGGANIGGSLDVLSDGGFDLLASLQNSPLFGLRVGTYGFPFGVEGSFVYSPSALVGGVFDGLIDANTNVLYTEVNVLLIILPGPISPFATAGAGLHYLDFNVADLVSFSRTKLGWNLGGGLKVDINRLALRVDIRDHVTTVGLGDLGLGTLGDLFGLAASDTRLHNFELSFGVGIRF